jgi:hypothetical protein
LALLTTVAVKTTRQPALNDMVKEEISVGTTQFFSSEHILCQSLLPSVFASNQSLLPLVSSLKSVSASVSQSRSLQLVSALVSQIGLCF